MLLDRRVAMIIGAGAGLGRAIAEAFKREGAVLCLTDLNEVHATEALSQVGAQEDGLAMALDVADAGQCVYTVDLAADFFGRIDILVNCAAVCLIDPILQVTPERWEFVFKVNTHGAFYCMQAAAKAMIPRRWGRIIQISAPATRQAFPLFTSFAASKAAVDSMVKAAAVEWAQYGITVNTIVPGKMTGGVIDSVEGEIAEAAGRTEQQIARDRLRGLPMGRRVEPSEVAEAAVWLASDAAAYVTAERFNFTGGLELP